MYFFNICRTLDACTKALNGATIGARGDLSMLEEPNKLAYVRINQVKCVFVKLELSVMSR